MKKIYALFIGIVFATAMHAQWPANYGGVMLQAFFWDSYEDTQWRNLTDQADTLSKYFDLLWVPNSSNCVAANSMGYLPVYWFDQRSSFGSRERYLREMIAAYKDRGTKIIEDVVLNHKAPVGKDGSWIDFANETWSWEGTTYNIEWTGADICRNDDGGWTAQQGWEVTGADDTGDDFSGARDLDHTSANVQKNCKIFLEYLLKDVGYSGFRLDMVKGYAPQYTKIYNEYAKPEFCVGEYWDGSVSALSSWINSTGKTSAAFDFALKYNMRDAFGGGDWGALGRASLANNADWNRYSVTFVDNHDTYENQDRLVYNVLPANAFILASPGTPCVFLKHWKRYPIAIGNMILARRAAGITNQSSIIEQRSSAGGFVLKTQGTKGSILCLVGFPEYDTTGFTCIAAGTNFAYYVSNNITVEGLRPGNDDDDTQARSVTIFVDAAQAPYLYAWTESGAQPNGAWPGAVMVSDTTISERHFWKHTFNVAPVNIIFHNGQGGSKNQTADIRGLGHDSYFTYNGDSLYTDITTDYYTPVDIDLPACAKYIEGHLFAYFQANKDYDMPYAWVWGEDSKNFCTTKEWPGDKMKWVGTDSQNRAVWLWDGGAITQDAEMPTGLLFSNHGAPQTSDFQFRNGGYYDATGLQAIVPNPADGIDAVQMVASPTQQTYNLQGQRVNGNYRGVVIMNGRKYLAR